MGRPRKPAKPAAAASSSSSAAFSIGNCKVEVHGSSLRCQSTEQEELTISGPRGARIVVSVDGAKSSSVGDGFDFILLSPSDVDERNKALLQEVLLLYKQELPTMDYAANTGRKSGKYKTLVLSSTAGHEEVTAALSYQLVPADTQYAEIPLAVVRPPYQRVGIGQLLYKELSQRLRNVGVTTIFCWADNGFESVGEVDTKGKICRIPVRADIKRALCFPGGSTLMVSHLKDLPAPQKSLLSSQQTYQFHTFAPDSISPSDTGTSTPSCEKLVPQTVACHNVSKTAAVERNEDFHGTGGCSFSDQQANKRTHETSSSSLKSKRVRCSQHSDHHQDMNQNEICGNPLSISNTPIHENSVHLMPNELSNPSIVAHVKSKISGDAKANISSNRSPSVMLMNIADETKKTQLIEVVEMLGGVVTCEGNSCTHLITGKVRMTLNFCIALCSGAWIVSPKWLKESFKKGKFVGEAEYVLQDDEFKVKYKSELTDAVVRAKERPCSLFSGYTFCLTKNIQPSVNVLYHIIKSSGGKLINKLDDITQPSKTIFLACEEDMELALDAAKRGIKTFSSEWFLSCVMTQELDLEAPQFTESL
uniref:BRCT domain-containing protein n=1 Tax=Oryza meridionalis TaxID=40149 RepID=A0A0E0DQU5_9ORYZ